MAGVDLLFNAADAVEQAGRAGLHPGPGELLIARIGFEATFGHMIQEGLWEGLILRHIRDFPRLRGVGDIAIGQQHHRRHKLRGDPHRLNRAVERVNR
jgi:hypothetical protein